MKKKLIALFLTACMAFSLAACGGEKKEEATTPATTAAAESSEAAAKSEAPAGSEAASEVKSAEGFVSKDTNKDGLGDVTVTKPIKLGFTMQTRTQFLSTMETAIKNLCDKMGIQVTSVDANTNANTQISQIQTFASQKMDGIICCCVTTDNGAQIMQAAGDIPVAFVNILPTDDLSGKKMTKIGSNDLEAGKFQGEFLCDFFKKENKTDINFVMMQGILGLQYTTDRTNSAIQALKDGGLNATCVYEDTGEYDRAKAQNKMQTFLGTGKEFDCVICNNDEMALGCIEAMKGAGLDPKKIPVVGIDATIQGLTAMKAGDLAMTVFQNPVGQGEAAVRAAVLMAEGKEVPPTISIAYEKVTPENCDQYIEFHKKYTSETK